MSRKILGFLAALEVLAFSTIISTVLFANHVKALYRVDELHCYLLADMVLASQGCINLPHCAARYNTWRLI